MKSLITKINMFMEKDNPIYGDSVTSFEYSDDGCGPYITIIQSNDKQDIDEIKLDLDEVEYFIKNLQHMTRLIKEGIQYEHRKK
jgi:hypothetical protein